MIGVLVAEDSPSQRAFLVHLLSQDPSLAVVGVARDGAEAVQLAVRHRPAVIVMDVHMPTMNGYEATREILTLAPAPIVMVSASLAGDEVRMSFEALRAGALALVAKPPGLDHPEHAAAVERLLTTIKLMSEVTVVRRRRSPGDAPVERKPSRLAGRKVRTVAIGASTGGPRVIAEILSGLSSELAATILLVQHMAPGFMEGFATWLTHATGLDVKVADGREGMAPGKVFLAPDGWQMGVTREGGLSLARDGGEFGFCPSVSYLFASVARGCGASAMGILLTGMGDDGAEGLLRLRQAGGVTVAQESESCVVFGMPKEAIALGGAEHVLTPRQIGEMLRALAT